MRRTRAVNDQKDRQEESGACSWPSPPERLILKSDEVHVFCTNLDLERPFIDSLERSLSADERERAGRFYFEKDRNHYVTARALLRDILGRYLNLPPAQIRFCYGDHGKPALAESFAKSRLRFNLSHAHGLALYAVARGREVGIDIELIRPDFADERIAEQFFSHKEVTMLRSLRDYMQQEAFFNCWTRKEAYVKARGEGLSLPLDQFSVSLTPGIPAALLSVEGDPEERSRWSLRELIPAPGYAAALAVEGKRCILNCWRWQSDGMDLRGDYSVTSRYFSSFSAL